MRLTSELNVEKINDGRKSNIAFYLAILIWLTGGGK